MNQKERKIRIAQREADLKTIAAMLTDGSILELTTEMMVSAHLQPNFVRPSAARPPKQQWANWVKGWKPLSVQGKAAKRYSRVWTAWDRAGTNLTHWSTGDVKQSKKVKKAS